jgi:hypothetical protein
MVCVCEVCLLKEQRHWPLQNQTRGSRLGSRIRAGGLLILRCGNEATRGSGGAARV